MRTGEPREQNISAFSVTAQERATSSQDYLCGNEYGSVPSCPDLEPEQVSCFCHCY
jgi:hypothetical protein